MIGPNLSVFLKYDWNDSTRCLARATKHDPNVLALAVIDPKDTEALKNYTTSLEQVAKFVMTNETKWFDNIKTKDPKQLHQFQYKLGCLSQKVKEYSLANKVDNFSYLTSAQWPVAFKVVLPKAFKDKFKGQLVSTCLIFRDVYTRADTQKDIYDKFCVAKKKKLEIKVKCQKEGCHAEHKLNIKLAQIVGKSKVSRKGFDCKSNELFVPLKEPITKPTGKKVVKVFTFKGKNEIFEQKLAALHKTEEKA